MQTEDFQLARLYDYTKFHIGIYLLAAGAMITISASQELSVFVGGLIKSPVLLLFAIGAMAVAGAAGGVIASSCASAASFDEVWNQPIGPWYFQIMPGWAWATIEHAAFWLSALLFTLAALI